MVLAIMCHLSGIFPSSLKHQFKIAPYILFFKKAIKFQRGKSHFAILNAFRDTAKFFWHLYMGGKPHTAVFKRLCWIILERSFSLLVLWLRCRYRFQNQPPKESGKERQILCCCCLGLSKSFPLGPFLIACGGTNAWSCSLVVPQGHVLRTAMP